MFMQAAGVSTGSEAQELREKEKKQLLGAGITTKYSQEIFVMLQQHPCCSLFP